MLPEYWTPTRILQNRILRILEEYWTLTNLTNKPLNCPWQECWTPTNLNNNYFRWINASSTNSFVNFYWQKEFNCKLITTTASAWLSLPLTVQEWPGLQLNSINLPNYQIQRWPMASQYFLIDALLPMARCIRDLDRTCVLDQPFTEYPSLSIIGGASVFI